MGIRNNGSRIFMTELMFSILYFIIIAAICVQCFASGYKMSSEASELTQAVNLASNACELFYADDTFKSFTDYYDSSWEECQINEASYKVTGIVSEQISNCSFERYMSVTVSTSDDAKKIYALSVEKGLGLED